MKLCESFGETVEESFFVECIRVKRIDRARSLFVILLKQHLSSIAIKNGKCVSPLLSFSNSILLKLLLQASIMNAFYFTFLFKIFDVPVEYICSAD